MTLHRLLSYPIAAWVAAVPFAPSAIAETASSPSPVTREPARNPADDPLEPANRAIFAFNQAVDDYVLAPVATVYSERTPKAVRTGTHNVVTNFGEPSVAINDGLQGNFDRAWTSTQRFVVNSTVGVAGIFDVAKGWDRPRHTSDFGQTLGVWGVAPGPSVQVPVFGPSNLRDLAGKVAGSYVNPLHWIQGSAMTVVSNARSGADVVDGRANSLQATATLRKGSTDYYAALRDAAARRRTALVAESRGQ